jgi:hypothetical protein
MSKTDDLVQTALQLSEELQPFMDRLAGRGPMVQGGALADLVSMFIAGHVVLGDPTATYQMREVELELFFHAVRALVAPSAQKMGTIVTPHEQETETDGDDYADCADWKAHCN